MGELGLSTFWAILSWHHSANHGDCWNMEAHEAGTKVLYWEALPDKRFVLDPSPQDRFIPLYFNDLIATGVNTFGNESDFSIWLQSRVPSLGDTRPIDLLGTQGGRQEVLNVLGRIEYGIY